MAAEIDNRKGGGEGSSSLFTFLLPSGTGSHKLRAATYIGDCVSVEFGDGLDAFETCHQFIVTFHLNHCLQGAEEMASQEGSGQGAKPLPMRMAPLHGSLLTTTKPLIYIRSNPQLSGSK